MGLPVTAVCALKPSTRLGRSTPMPGPNDGAQPEFRIPGEPGGGALDSSGIKEILIKQQDAQEKIIEQILQCRGVVEVVPSVSFPDTGPKIEDPGPSVSVQVVSIEDPPLVTKEEIRELLKNSVQNVKEDKISIVITPKKPLIPLPARADAPGASSFKWPSKRVLGIAGGLLLALGTTAGVWFLRGRRQDEWEEYDDESEASTPPEESGPAKQLPAA